MPLDKDCTLLAASGSPFGQTTIRITRLQKFEENSDFILESMPVLAALKQLLNSRVIWSYFCFVPEPPCAFIKDFYIVLCDHRCHFLIPIQLEESSTDLAQILIRLVSFK